MSGFRIDRSLESFNSQYFVWMSSIRWRSLHRVPANTIILCWQWVVSGRESTQISLAFWGGFQFVTFSERASPLPPEAQRSVKGAIALSSVQTSQSRPRLCSRTGWDLDSREDPSASYTVSAILLVTAWTTVGSCFRKIAFSVCLYFRWNYHGGIDTFLAKQQLLLLWKEHTPLN